MALTRQQRTIPLTRSDRRPPAVLACLAAGAKPLGARHRRWPPQATAAVAGRQVAADAARFGIAAPILRATLRATVPDKPVSR
jgi:hypothetical protein